MHSVRGFLDMPLRVPEGKLQFRGLADILKRATGRELRWLAHPSRADSVPEFWVARFGARLYGAAPDLTPTTNVGSALAKTIAHLTEHDSGCPPDQQVWTVWLTDSQILLVLLPRDRLPLLPAGDWTSR